MNTHHPDPKIAMGAQQTATLVLDFCRFCILSFLQMSFPLCLVPAPILISSFPVCFPLLNFQSYFLFLPVNASKKKKDKKDPSLSGKKRKPSFFLCCDFYNVVSMSNFLEIDSYDIVFLLKNHSWHVDSREKEVENSAGGGVETLSCPGQLLPVIRFLFIE